MTIEWDRPAWRTGVDVFGHPGHVKPDAKKKKTNSTEVGTGTMRLFSPGQLYGGELSCIASPAQERTDRLEYIGVLSTLVLVYFFIIGHQHALHRI